MSSHITRLARLSVRLLIATLVFGVVAGLVIVLIWRRDVNWTVYNIPILIVTFGYLGAILFALPAFFLGIYNLMRGQWAVGLRRIMVLAGVVTVFLGAELFSHYLVPCDLVMGWGWGTPDWSVPWWGTGGGFACRQVVTGFGNVNGVYSRIHLLHHTLTGGVPTLMLFLWMLKQTNRAAELDSAAPLTAIL
jgi:hypothetical protein